jgi:stress-induced morphogen
MIQPTELERRIVAAIPGAKVSVRDLTGTLDHYHVEVVAEAFRGASAIQRHRMVQGPLKDVLGGPLHAIELVTKTPDEV